MSKLEYDIYPQQIEVSLSLHILLAELLNFYKFPGDDIPIVRGSALSALEGKNEEIGKKAILKLMEFVDSYIPDPMRQLQKSFLMPVEDVFTIQVTESCSVFKLSFGGFEI